MGLGVSHNCWNAPYSAFMRFREALVREAWGIELRRMEGFADPGVEVILFDRYKHDALTQLIDHSDCEGMIEHKHLLPLAIRLEELAPKLANMTVLGWGEAARWRDAALQFAKGCRKAHASDECLEFR